MKALTSQLNQNGKTNIVMILNTKELDTFYCLQRAEEIQKLQEEIAILRTAIEPLVKKPLPRHFVKDPHRRNDDTPDVNRHSVANAYR